MPQVTVYIRAEDFERWAAVEKKSEFIHQALDESLTLMDDISKIGLKLPPVAKKPSIIKTPDDALAIVKTIPSSTQHYCPSGHSIPHGRDRCMGKSCKYS